MVDLETHRVVDLLPDRCADSSAQWLAQHPGITVVSRDRSALYAGGITRGAPHAVQVVDRFHLVANFRDALETFFSAHPTVLKEAAARTAQSMRQEAGVPPPIGMYRGRRDQPQNWKKRQEHQRQQRHAARVALYETICRLKEAGTPIKAIARQLKMSRSTVYVHLTGAHRLSPGCGRDGRLTKFWRPTSRI